MTDIEDWKIRAAHLYGAAERLERRAQALIDEAVEFRRVAGRCEANADRMLRDAANECMGLKGAKTMGDKRVSSLMNFTWPK